MVTVIATDSANTAMHDVTVMVTNVDDDVTLLERYRHQPHERADRQE